MHISKHLSISGRVQGVGYRAWMSATARQMGVHGWVRNRTDGTVEACISGTKAQISELIAACHQGPPAANVVSIEISEQPPGVAPGFLSLPTV